MGFKNSLSIRSQRFLKKVGIIYVLVSLIPMLIFTYIIVDLRGEKQISAETVFLVGAAMLLSLLGYKLLQEVAKMLLELRENAKKAVSQEGLLRNGSFPGDEIEEIGSSLDSLSSMLKEKMREVEEYESKIKQVNTQITKKVDSLVSLSKMANHLSSVHDLHRAGDGLLGYLEQNIDMDRGIFIYTKDKNWNLIGQRGYANSVKTDSGSRGIVAATLRLAALIDAKSSPKVLNREDYLTISNSQQIKDILSKLEISGAMVSQYSDEEGHSCVIVVGNSLEKPYTRDDLELLTLLAGQSAVIIENIELYLKTEQMAITDEMTGLYNYRYFRKRLIEEITRASRTGRKFSILMADVDHFKKLNDTYGHQDGDMVLKGLTEVLRSNVRPMDIVARYGGEEFVIILPEFDIRKNRQRAEAIREAIERYIFRGMKSEIKDVTASFGASVFPEDGTSADQLCIKADEALYQAKRNGGNRTCLHPKVRKNYMQGSERCLKNLS